MSQYKSRLLRGKNIIITGCNRGIGFSIMKNLASNGANIWACVRKITEKFLSEITKISEEFEVWIKAIEIDLSSTDSINKATREIFSEKLAIEALVNNAGMVSDNFSFNMTPIKQMRTVFDVNFFGPTTLMQSISRKMILKKRGKIINILSIAALDSNYGQYEYIASKAALAGVTKKLARELAPYNISVNGIAPGLIETDMLSKMSAKLKKDTVEKNIMGRLGDVNEVADLVTYLASNLSTFINGQIIRVDGGF